MAIQAHQPLEEGEIYDVLRNDRRRLALERLREADGKRLSVGELSEQVAAAETGETPPPRQKRQSAYVSLHQTHLPKLDELGIVDYDAEEKVVRLEDRIRDIEAYMGVPSRDLDWGAYYVSLAALGACATVAADLSAPLVGTLRPTVWAVGFFVLLGVSAVVQTTAQHGRLPFMADPHDEDGLL
ncbi:DUF7344 domain-containing protein [Halomarina oriensis]|uniref:DUF7344 domain-containing protein n=1 Tax=Halomarina oriensis TaxID=671145 RepID=A0A6B0GPF9_9EURY|nr:hypothetical protein [Halomarina oriensis]MWG36714.1 hypothetical protein [Halomarina oriensis]